MDEKVALLALVLGNPHHWADVASAVEDRGSAVSVLNESPVGQQQFLGDVSKIEQAVEEASSYLRLWGDEGIHFSTLLDQDYPAQLLSIHQRPPFVTWAGTLSSSDWEGVAIVGTRNPSQEGARAADSLSRSFAERGVTVVSGLAAGIDSAAHTAALDVGGRTVAVIGTGLHVTYPRANAALQRAIGNAGMVLSQFLPDSPPSKTSFPMRNAIMSGFASATIVVEAGEKSGARMQARLALQHGRPVFLMDQLREREWARNIAERPGARFVTSAEEIVAILDRLNSRTEQLVDG